MIWHVGRRQRSGAQSQNARGQDAGHFGATLVRRQKRIVDRSHGAAPGGVAHSDLRLATGALSGGNKKDAMLVVIAMAIDASNSHRYKEAFGDILHGCTLK